MIFRELVTIFFTVAQRFMLRTTLNVWKKFRIKDTNLHDKSMSVTPVSGTALLVK